MLEMNLDLAWGLNEFRYGSQETARAQNLAAVDPNKVRQAALKHPDAGPMHNGRDQTRWH